MIWATSWDNLFMPYANNEGADQTAHPRSRIRAFVVRCLDSKIHVPLLSKFKVSRLASLCSWAGQFESYLVGNPEDRFSSDKAHFIALLAVRQEYAWDNFEVRPKKKYICGSGKFRGGRVMELHISFILALPFLLFKQLSLHVYLINFLLPSS